MIFNCPNLYDLSYDPNKEVYVVRVNIPPNEGEEKLKENGEQLTPVQPSPSPVQPSPSNETDNKTDYEEVKRLLKLIFY